MESQNRIALVTGAAKGLGLACAQSLLDAGHRVVVTDIAAPSKDLFPEAQRDRIMPAAFDVTDWKRAEELLKEIDAAWGPVGILVNNAAISPKKSDGKPRRFMEVSIEEMEQVMRVNLYSTLRLSQLVVPYMQRQNWGRIINFSSMAARTRAMTGPSYTCSKHAIIGLSKGMAEDLGPFGITVNSVAPGRILTDMVLQAGEEVNKGFADRTPLKRLGRPDEVGSVVAFLASEGAGFLNGTIIDIGGGLFIPS